MPYPTYTAPSTGGITFAFGGGIMQPLAANDLCVLSDAQLIQAAFGGTLVNAAETSGLGMVFSGLNPASQAQPFYLTGITNPGFVGPMVAEMYAPNSVNGGGVGNPGSWTGQTSGNPKWVPQAPAVVTSTATATNDAPGVDAGALLGALGGAGSAGGGGLTVTEAAQLANIQRLVVRLGTVFGIQ